MYLVLFRTYDNYVKDISQKLYILWEKELIEARSVQEQN